MPKRPVPPLGLVSQVPARKGAGCVCGWDLGVGWVPVAVLVACTVHPRPCDGRRPSPLLAQAPPGVRQHHPIHATDHLQRHAPKGRAQIGKQEALPFGASVRASVGVGAHRACQRDDEDGAKHVHDPARRTKHTSTKDTSGLDYSFHVVHWSFHVVRWYLRYTL